MFSSGMELINHTSAYKSIRSLPTKLQFSKCSWWSWTDHCDTVASISYNRCMRVVISLSPFDRWQCSVWSRESGGRVSRNETPRGSLKEGGMGGGGGNTRKQTRSNLFFLSLGWSRPTSISFRGNYHRQ